MGLTCTSRRQQRSAVRANGEVGDVRGVHGASRLFLPGGDDHRLCRAELVITDRRISHMSRPSHVALGPGYSGRLTFARRLPAPWRIAIVVAELVKLRSQYRLTGADIRSARIPRRPAGKEARDMPTSATPERVIRQIVEAMRTLAGPHPGLRPVHAKGLVCSGAFRASADAPRVTRAPHFTGQSVPTIVRFANANGNRFARWCP